MQTWPTPKTTVVIFSTWSIYNQNMRFLKLPHLQIPCSVFPKFSLFDLGWPEITFGIYLNMLLKEMTFKENAFLDLIYFQSPWKFRIKYVLNKSKLQGKFQVKLSFTFTNIVIGRFWPLDLFQPFNSTKNNRHHLLNEGYQHDVY